MISAMSRQHFNNLGSQQDLIDCLAIQLQTFEMFENVTGIEREYMTKSDLNHVQPA